MDYGMKSIAAITVICLLAAQVVKVTPLNKKWLPLICGLLGGGLGIAGICLLPGYPAPDIVTAASDGIISGLAATGGHQIIKQLTKESETNGDS